MIYDAITVNASYFLALWIRHDLKFSLIDKIYIVYWRAFAPYYTVICLLVYALCRLYKSIWEYVSYTELAGIILASFITAITHLLAMVLFYGRMPVSYFLMGAILQFIFLCISRFGYRFFHVLSNKRISREDLAKYKKVMIIGAGSAGQMILRDIINSKMINEVVCCIIDDDRSKWNRYIENVPIVGGRDDIMASAKKYNIDKIYLAIPSASVEEKRDILNICSETDCELKQLPGYYQFVLNQIGVSSLADVSVEDLLGRDPIKTDLEEVFEFISGKTVLVTGGGGSIGSELCRQIAMHKPRQLIIFDIYENSTYGVQLELKNHYPDLDLVVLIGSVRDSRKMYDVFETYRPQIVYHAAAHKHVPLMEDSPCEAIKNNAIGTYKTAFAAMMHGCEKFVLISTDKAVNPTNIMGASKRICEMIIQSFDAKIKEGRADEIPQLFTHYNDHGVDNLGRKKEFDYQSIRTDFTAVRFGNVLASNGSVIPIFQKQIENGGPVTVTHPDIIRYFMTIPEAVSLVLLAGTYGKGGEIFVLDMGSPVKIDTLARNLIRLSGYRPDIDIKIEYCGLRPGEKLYEERLMEEEGLATTENEMIHIGKPLEFDAGEFFVQLSELMKMAYRNDRNIRSKVEEIVTTYHPVKEEKNGEN
ncbi:MAG: polysaccharide biosynthesis protein [Erysipelotrichaceae bacterium]|nr:polysaccharide biosynthesis protein [Erysipelotrichaceae bacterium]